MTSSDINGEFLATFLSQVFLIFGGVVSSLKYQHHEKIIYYNACNSFSYLISPNIWTLQEEMLADFQH